MRVCQLLTQLERAGAQNLAAWLNSALPELESEASIICIYKKSDNELIADEACASLARPKTLTDGIRTLARVRRMVADERPDVLVAHTHYAIVVAVLLKLSYWQRPNVVAVHHWPLSRYPAAARLFWKASDRLGLLASNVFVSSTIEEVAKAHPAIIPNPIPRPSSDSGGFRREIDLLIVARHSVEKNIEVAIRAMRHLPERHLTLIGTGPETAALKNLIAGISLEKSVSMMGSVPNSTVRSCMKACSALILPSRWEAMPIVLLEAVSEDVPIIVSNISQHDFVLAPGAALGFEAEDDYSLAQRVTEISNITVAERLAEGRSRIRTAQSPEKIAEEWASLLQASSSHVC